MTAIANDVDLFPFLIGKVLTKDMANALNISSAFLSKLETGK